MNTHFVLFEVKMTPGLYPCKLLNPIPGNRCCYRIPGWDFSASQWRELIYLFAFSAFAFSKSSTIWQIRLTAPSMPSSAELMEKS